MMRILLSLLAVLFLIYTAATALTQVRPGERAVVRRFGRILPEKPRPGLHVGWPWGIDEVERVAIGVRSVSVGFAGNQAEQATGTPLGQLLTGDHNLINLRAEIQYSVLEDRVEKYFFNRDRADLMIARAAEAALAEWIAGRNVDDVLLTGQRVLPIEAVGIIQARLDPYDLGVRVEQCIARLNPPEEVKDAFDRVAQAHNSIETQTNAAHQTAQRKEREADAEVFRIERQTAAYVQSQDLQTRAEAENFLKRLGQYRALVKANPNYLNTLWLDEMAQTYARMQQAGRLDLLDDYLTGEGLNILQFPSLPKKR